jgi:hypothetical protein
MGIKSKTYCKHIRKYHSVSPLQLLYANEKNYEERKQCFERTFKNIYSLGSLAFFPMVVFLFFCKVD